MLSRRTLLERPLPSTLTPFPSCSCSLLGAPRKVNAFKISALQPLLQNTRGGGIPTLLRRASLPPSYAPHGASIPCALNRLRILPVTTGGVPPVSHYPLPFYPLLSTPRRLHRRSGYDRGIRAASAEALRCAIASMEIIGFTPEAFGNAEPSMT